MMDKNHATVTIAGQEFKLSGDDSAQYMGELAEMVNERYDKVRKQYPMLSASSCALIVSLNMADELYKLQQDYKALDRRISELREMPLPQKSAAPVKRPFESREKTTV